MSAILARLTRSAFVLLALSSALVLSAPAVAASLVTNLTVNNSPSQGGTGDAYQVNANGFESGSTEYVDRSYTYATPIPSAINDQTYIETADGDKGVDEGSSDFMSFTVTESVTVYVAYDKGITTAPTWLANSFSDTGTELESDEGGADHPFELYSANFSANATVTLGGNYPSGWANDNGMYSVIVVPAAVTLANLVVNNTASQGGTDDTYSIQNAAFASGATQYVDRSYTIGTPVPSSVGGQTYIETANGDKGADAGGTNFMSFSASQNVIVYVVHDTQISSKPAWLTANFLDTGTQVYASSGSTEPFEVYENVYPANTTITLGSNIPSGWNTQNSSMYTVVAAPASSSATPPTAPSSVQPICATAAVVGLQWTASTDPVGVFAYRISRNGTVIATVSYAQTAYSDTTVSGSTSYQYVVTAVDAAGLSTDSSPVGVTTAPASADGDAAYCPSSTITSMTFDYSGAFTETSGNTSDSPPYTDGSDLWGATWGQDGNTYLTFGDGWGLCGEDDTGSEEGNDYTSLGFAVISGPPPFSGCPSQFANIYGGYNSSHPYDGGQAGLLNGKIGPLIAIGANFYGFGGIWRASDSGGPNGTPNHDEVVYSLGNAYSWVDSPWNFCSASSAGVPNQTGGLDGTVGVCPSGVVNYGAGNSGAPDNYVYLYASPNTQGYWVPGPPTSPWLTYLLRVPNNEVTTESAYQYYSGLDINGDPIWTSRISQAQPVFIDSNAPIESQQHPGYSFSMAMTLNSVVYDSPLGRYIALAQGLKVGQVAFYESAKPWGPWSVIFYDNINPADGTGGWGNLGAGTWNGSTYTGADPLSVNIANAWTSSDGTSVWMTFSSDGLAPADASFPGLAGNELDSLNIVEATLTTGSGGGSGNGILGSDTPTPPATVDNSDFNTMSGSQVTVGSSSVSVTSMTVWVNGVDPAPNNQFQVAIYTDNGGTPDALVAYSGSQALTPNSWNTVAISATLNANTTYWLFYNTNGLHGASNDMSLSSGVTGANRWWSNGSVTFGSWPATAPAGTLASGEEYSMYASY